MGPTEPLSRTATPYILGYREYHIRVIRIMSAGQHVSAPAKRQPCPVASMVRWDERLGCSGGRRASTASGGSSSAAPVKSHSRSAPPGDPKFVRAPDLRTRASRRTATARRMTERLSKGRPIMS